MATFSRRSWHFVCPARRLILHRIFQKNSRASKLVWKSALSEGNMRTMRIWSLYIFFHLLFWRGFRIFIHHKQKLKHSLFFFNFSTTSSRTRRGWFSGFQFESPYPLFPKVLRPSLIIIYLRFAISSLIGIWIRISRRSSISISIQILNTFLIIDDNMNLNVRSKCCYC